MKTKLEIMREVTRELRDIAGDGSVSMYASACYVLLVEARARIAELEAEKAIEDTIEQYDDALKNLDDFPPIPDGWERFYSLEEYRRGGYKFAYSDWKEYMTGNPNGPAMMQNRAYIQPKEQA